MRRLLLLVDLQEDFLCRDGLSPHRDSLPERAAFLLEHFRKNGAPIFHLRTKVEKTSDHRMPHWKAENRWTCLEGSPGYLPPSILKEKDGEVVLHKTGFSFPSLADVVAEQEAHEVILCGVMLHACVRQAAVQLHEAGLRVAIADDAVGSDDPIHAAITKRYLQDRGVAFLTSAKIAYSLNEINSPKDMPSSDRETKILSNARQEWEATSFEDRAKFIDPLARLLRENAEDLAGRMAEDIGKPLLFGIAEAQRSAEMIEAIATRLAKASFENKTGVATVRRRPLGTVAIITPWNNPVYIPLGKIVPALLCGNTVAWKPAPEAAEISRWLLDTMRTSGVPNRVLRMIEGTAIDGRRLIENAQVNAVSLTGSSKAGYSASEVCARRHIPFQAELGGNNSAIVWTDAELDDAAEKIVSGAFEMAGQRCTANRRVIVPETIAVDFIEKLVDSASRLFWNDPEQPKTQIGPLISHDRMVYIEQVLARAEESGFRLHFPLGRHPESVLDLSRPWCPPCIVECDEPDHELVQEEFFAPVLVVQKAKDWEHALALANGVRQGLAAALFSREEERISDFLQQARAGILKISASTADAAVDVPFGGWKASGTGPPEHGDGDLEFYTRSQTLYLG